MRINSNVFIAGLLSLFLCVTVSAQESATTSQVVIGLINGKPVSGGILNGKARNLVVPKYPVEAKAQNLSGAVNVSILVDLEGNVIEAKAVSGNPVFHEAVVAALKSKFSPTILSGEPVYVTGTIVYNFSDDDPEKERETKNVEDKIKVFHLSILLEAIISSVEPFDEWRECLLKDDLKKIGQSFPDLKNEVALLDSSKDTKGQSPLNVSERIASKVKYQLFGADLWLFQIGEPYQRIASQFRKANGGKGGLNVEKLDENVIKSNLLEIQKLMISAPPEVPGAFIQELKEIETFAGKSDLMQRGTLYELRTALRRGR